MTDTAVLDTVTITAHHFEEIRSTGADVLISVSERSVGSRSSGRVAALRGQLVERGFSDSDLMLQGVDRTGWAWIPIALGIVVSIAALLATGTLRAALAAGGGFVVLGMVLAALKVGTISALLKVRAGNAEQVSRLLDTVLACSSAEVRSITWRYEVDPASQGDWAARAVERASLRAARIAEALGVRILGVHTFREEYVLPQAQATGAAPAEAAASMRSKTRSTARMQMSVGESLGAAPSSTERSGVTVHIDYRVGPLAS
jgi:hypothetical protein